VYCWWPENDSCRMRELEADGRRILIYISISAWDEKDGKVDSELVVSLGKALLMVYCFPCSAPDCSGRKTASASSFEVMRCFCEILKPSFSTCFPNTTSSLRISTTSLPNCSTLQAVSRFNTSLTSKPTSSLQSIQISTPSFFTTSTKSLTYLSFSFFPSLFPSR